MKKVYTESTQFVDDLHMESVKDLVLFMGYLTEDDFKGTKVSCVFHDKDHTPSLQITDSFFKCYSCGAKGDIIKWVELSHGLNFIEAVNLIAERMNIQLKTESFTKYGGLRLEIDKEWSQYIKDMSVILGSGTPLSNHVKEVLKDYFPFEVGYDRRSNYIVLPFTSKTGSVLGFTKRRIDFPDTRKPPKWLHSSIEDSLTAHCSNIFNLHGAHKAIDKSKRAFLVEGPKDVAAFVRASYKDTIAICGVSNFNQKVLDTLGPIKELVIAFDGDSAGKEAMMRNIITISSLNPVLAKSIEVVLFEEGTDPADITKEDLHQKVEGRTNGIKWLMKEATEDIVVDFASKVESSIIKQEIVMLLNKRLGYNSSQSREWLNYKIKKTKVAGVTASYSTKDRLLATIGENQDISVQPLDISEDEARKILALRYNYK